MGLNGCADGQGPLLAERRSSDLDDLKGMRLDKASGTSPRLDGVIMSGGTAQDFSRIHTFSEAI